LIYSSLFVDGVSYIAILVEK